MKVSELIKELELYLQNNGDHEAVVYAKRYGDWDQYPIATVESVKDEVTRAIGSKVALLSDVEYKARPLNK